MASLLQEIRDLADAVRRIEEFLGMQAEPQPVESGNQLAALGWTPQQVDETMAKFASLGDDWSDPSMDAYDSL